MAAVTNGRRALILLAALGLAGCSANGATTGKGVPAAAAAALADRADGVAAALAAGNCDQAAAEARSLQTDVAALKVEPAVRAEAVAGADRLVAAISCVPPPAPDPTAVDQPPPGGDPGPGKEKKHKDGHGNDG